MVQEFGHFLTKFNNIVNLIKVTWKNSLKNKKKLKMKQKIVFTYMFKQQMAPI